MNNTLATKLWKMELKLIGHNMPLIRVFIILRKFRVGIEKIDVKRLDDNHWKASFLLDLSLSPRTDTVFKKVSMLYDVAAVKYKNTHEHKTHIILK